MSLTHALTTDSTCQCNCARNLRLLNIIVSSKTKSSVPRSRGKSSLFVIKYAHVSFPFAALHDCIVYSLPDQNLIQMHVHVIYPTTLRWAPKLDHDGLGNLTAPSNNSLWTDCMSTQEYHLTWQLSHSRILSLLLSDTHIRDVDACKPFTRLNSSACARLRPSDPGCACPRTSNARSGGLSNDPQQLASNVLCLRFFEH